MEPGTCPPCASQHFPCPSTGPQATSWSIIPSEKADTGGGLPCGKSSLMHALLVGMPGENHPVLVLGRGEGRRGVAGRGALTVQQSGLLLCCWQGAVRGACEQEIKSSGRGFSLTNRGFVCLFSWWL